MNKFLIHARILDFFRLNICCLYSGQKIREEQLLEESALLSGSTGGKLGSSHHPNGASTLPSSKKNNAKLTMPPATAATANIASAETSLHSSGVASDNPSITNVNTSSSNPNLPRVGSSASRSSNAGVDPKCGKDSGERTTWIHDIFQGVLTSETVCLTCETVRRKDENFLDLSLDIVENNCSITHCLRNFSHTETLNSDHKFFCETCCSKQEASKRMMIKKLPQVLAIHLKRFKFQESLGRYTKLAYRVVYPMQLRIVNTVRIILLTFKLDNFSYP